MGFAHIPFYMLKRFFLFLFLAFLEGQGLARLEQSPILAIVLFVTALIPWRTTQYYPLWWSKASISWYLCVEFN
jgi:hypothetical protein